MQQLPPLYPLILSHRSTQTIYPKVHAALGIAATSPLDEEPPLAYDLEFACRMMTEHDDFGKWQRKQKRILQSFFNKLAKWEEFYAPLRSESSRVTCLKAKPHILDSLSRSVAWPDAELPWMTVVGWIPSPGQPPPYWDLQAG